MTAAAAIAAIQLFAGGPRERERYGRKTPPAAVSTLFWGKAVVIASYMHTTTSICSLVLREYKAAELLVVGWKKLAAYMTLLCSVYIVDG